MDQIRAARSVPIRDRSVDRELKLRRSESERLQYGDIAKRSRDNDEHKKNKLKRIIRKKRVW